LSIILITNPDILHYAAGYIDDSDEEENNPTDYIYSLLLSAGAESNSLTPLISHLNELITDRIARNPMKKTLEPVRLENTVHMSAQRGTGSTLNLVGPKVDLDSVTGRKVETRVDVKKLEKVFPLLWGLTSRRNVKFERNGKNEPILLVEQTMNPPNLLNKMNRKLMKNFSCL
jgi:hypothetical protein